MNKVTLPKSQPEPQGSTTLEGPTDLRNSTTIEKDILLHKIVRLSHKMPEPDLPLAVSLLETLVEHMQLRRAA